MIETLETATALQPSHLSVYDLQVEDGTVFSTWYSAPRDGSGGGGGDDDDDYQKKKSTSKIAKIPTMPNEESVAFMYKFGAGYLKSKGYEHYEGTWSEYI